MKEYSALNLINNILKKDIYEVEISNKCSNMTVGEYEQSYIHDKKIDISIKCCKKIKMGDIINKLVKVEIKPCNIDVNGNLMRCTKCLKTYSIKKKGFGHEPLCRKNYPSITTKWLFKEKKPSSISIEEDESQKVEDKIKIDDVKIIKINKDVYKYMKNGNFFIKKYTKKKELDIINKINDCNKNIFPEIIKFENTENNRVIIYTDFYESEKIDYSCSLSYVKNYIKSLLFAIEKLHAMNYVHGDIKPDNFLYEKEDNYHLIDFDHSGIEGSCASGSGTYPFSAPERNVNMFCYNKHLLKANDLWSVGIILLFFMAEKDIFSINTLSGEEKYIYEYRILYGKTNSCKKYFMMNYIEEYVDKFDNNFIENNIKRKINEREKYFVSDLIKKLLQINYKKRLSAENALKHGFFNNIPIPEGNPTIKLCEKKFTQKFLLNMDLLIKEENGIDKDYYEHCVNLVKQKEFLNKNKFDQIKSFKFCTICYKNKNEKLLFCDICDNAYHISCKKFNLCDCMKSTKVNKKLIIRLKTYMFINRTINTLIKKKEIKLLLPNLINKENTTIIDILRKYKMEFSNELVYEMDEQYNNYLLEFGFYEMNYENKKIYYDLKNFTKKGNYNYVKIEHDDNQGYVVKANTLIKKDTLICEYTGDVLFLKDVFNILKKKKKKNDSIFDLILTPTCDTSLIIFPYKNANLGRFLSGINNSNKQSIDRINVNSYRVSIEKKIHVILVASKDISENEILYYDYNAAYHLYKTSHFV